jgi:glycosyltransferase involved in cell wall biosynthesis
LDEKPLVSIITPVYNGEKYLAECIVSVLSQTYSNWEYLIANNCSTDHTLSIAKRYESEDERVKVYTNPEFVNALRNHNLALQRISPKSRYIKFVHADDKLFPECIEKMVDVIQDNPNVGVVGSYVLYGKEVRCVGIPYPETVVKGKDVCRATLKGQYTVFGPPTVTLLRADLVNRAENFYREDILLADADVCFKLLMNSDFGFVHQILSCVRLHEGTRTARLIEPFERQTPEMLEMQLVYGKAVLTGTEHNRLTKKKMNQYYRLLAKRLFFRKPRGF